MSDFIIALALWLGFWAIFLLGSFALIFKVIDREEKKKK